jgi:RNA polymerase sigma-70 factor, ECF subfamily
MNAALGMHFPYPAAASADRPAPRAGDANATAFASLYEANAARIYAHIRGRVAEPELAEDLTAQTFLRAWQSFDRYRPMEGRPFVAWLFTIANNLVVDHYRRSRRELVGIKGDPRDAGRDDPEWFAVNGDLRDQIRAAIATLKPYYQQVVTLRLVDGLEYDQIAEITGKSPGALRVALCRALAALRGELAHLRQVGG